MTSALTETHHQPRSLHAWLIYLNEHPWAAINVLIAVNLLCHWQTIGGFFLADDFVHVAYLKQVFDGHPELLLKNFYSTWLQTEGTNFYRPFISLTLALDRLLFGFNAAGFHFTNFAYQCLATIGLFLATREVCRIAVSNERGNGFLAESATVIPVVSALLFAVHPLHSEVVSWIIARVDSVCAAFYLFAMWLFLIAVRPQNSTRRKLYIGLSSVFFVLSLISKEMAVTLPPALVLLLVLFPNGEKETGRSFFSTVIKTLISAFKETWHLWLILIVYLIFRAFALGSITGGYQGSIGEGLSESTLSRILSLQSIQRVVFPLNAEVFTSLKRFARPLMILYAVALILFVVRMVQLKQKKISLKLFGFAMLWFLLVMVPAIPVWNLTETLQGSRFIYMGTAPLCLLLAVILSESHARSAPGSAGSLPALARCKRGPNTTYDLVLNDLQSAVSIAMVVAFAIIVFGNNGAWVQAGSELRALRNELETTVNKLPANERVALLNLPHRHKGAHMLYNAATLSVLLEPPLTKETIYPRVATFEPVLFGDEDLLRISRVRNMVSQGNKFHFFHWDREAMKLVPIEFRLDNKEFHQDEACSALVATDIDARGNRTEATPELRSAGAPAARRLSALQAPLRVLPDGSIVVTPEIDLEPASVDFLDLCISANGTAGGSAEKTVPVVVQWNTADSATFTPPASLVTTVPLDGKTYRMRLHVSEHKRWLAHGKIHRIGISTPVNGAGVVVHGISLLNGKQSIPFLTTAGKNFAEDESGVVRAGGKNGHFSYDAESIDGAASVVFEISKPNAWFEHYTNTHRDRVRCPKALKSWTLDALKGNDVRFDLKHLGGPGFYELRTAAVGRDQEVVGYFSDPILFQLGH